MRMTTGRDVTRAGVAAAERAVALSVRRTDRSDTARTTAYEMRWAPAAMRPWAKHSVRPDRRAPFLRMITRLAGSVVQAVTDVAGVEPVLRTRMRRRICSPLTRRVRLGSTVTARVGGLAGVTAFDSADAAEVPAALVAVAVKR